MQGPPVLRGSKDIKRRTSGPLILAAIPGTLTSTKSRIACEMGKDVMIKYCRTCTLTHGPSSPVCSPNQKPLPKARTVLEPSTTGPSIIGSRQTILHSERMSSWRLLGHR